MKLHCRTWVLGLILGLACSPGLAAVKVERDLGIMMLRRAKGRLISDYYDTTFHGFSLAARCAEAEQEIAKAQSNAQIFRIIGQVFMDLGDSHTLFLPPARTARVRYGWTSMVVGDACYVRTVNRKSDAAKQGLRPGDRIEAINGIAVNRARLWKLQYLFEALDPQGGLHVAVETLTGEKRELDLMAEVKQEAKQIDLVGDFAEQSVDKLVRRSEAAAKLHASAFAEVGDTLVWRLPGFNRLPSELDDGIRRMGHAKSVILDLRGNKGGLEDTMVELISRVFNRDVTVGVTQERDKKTTLLVKGAGSAFMGLLIVLVDGESASAAEIFARVVQIEDRGIVIGDRTEGAVQRARRFPELVGANPGVLMGISVTVGTFIMRDGRPLENVGVMPDLPVRPTGADMAARRDPALARALAQTGHKLTPQEAGRLLRRDQRDEPVD